MRYCLPLTLCIFIAGCAGQEKDPAPTPSVNEDKIITEEHPQSKSETEITYLALGDSYTIGQSVDESERWPVQLGRQLADHGIEVAELTIIAQTGWTTKNLQAAIDRKNFSKTFDMVSLLIGVNNQYQGASIELYKKEFKELVQTAIALANNDPAKVFVLSIPDYSVTPFAQNSNPQKIAEEINAFNRANKKIALAAGVQYFNITPISRKAKQDPTLLADDGLHPSGKMYGAWTDLILKDIIALISL